MSPDEQQAVLARVLARVGEATARGIVPVVQVDLDLTALCPRVRTARALAEVGKRFRVYALCRPEGLPVLPGYTDEAWGDFVSRAGLRDRHPDRPWGVGKDTIHSVFHGAYWTDAWLADDEPTAGLGAFVRRVDDLGGRVVFVSGRWRIEQIPASIAALQRAGIEAPHLVIGNHRHERNVLPGEEPWSDARVKAAQQEEIRSRWGVPVAVFDDRAANRAAVIEGNREFLEARGLPQVLGIAVAIPDFSHDPATDLAPERISTFEGVAAASPDPRREPWMAARHPPARAGTPYMGEITGIGRNGRGYVLPRRAAADAGAALTLPPRAGDPPFSDLARADDESLTEEAFMDAAEATLPEPARRQLGQVLARAEAAARSLLAAPFPGSDADRSALRRSLACTWLHARDMDTALAAMGYPLLLEGVHDLEDLVPAREVIGAVTRGLQGGAVYSEWLLRWLARLDPLGVVNVGFANPNLTVGLWHWSESAQLQNAMDVHRIAAHHQGDSGDRYDPVEATMNNLLHAREGIYGVQKTPVMTWTVIDDQMATHAGARALAKSSWGASFLADAIPIVRRLEAQGALMPWSKVERSAASGGNARES